MPITRATNLAGLGTIFDSLTDGGGLSISGISTFSDLNITRVNITGVGTISNGSITTLNATTGNIVTGVTTNFTSTNVVITGVTTVSAGTSALPSISPSGDSNTGIFFPSADHLNFSTGGTSRVQIDSDGDINIDGGTVFVDAVNNRFGVGTTAVDNRCHIATSEATTQYQPVLRLETTSTGDFGPALLFEGNRNSISGTASIAIDTSSGGASSLVYTADSIHRWIGNSKNSEYLRLDASGRLLIRTSSGSGDALLAVQGRQSDTARGGILQLQRGQAASALSVGDDIGSIRFSDNTSGNTGFAEILCASDAASGSGDFPGRLVFSTTANADSSPTERMRITSDGFIKAKGNKTSYFNDSGTWHELLSTQGNMRTLAVGTDASTITTNEMLNLVFTAASPDNNIAAFIRCEDSTASRLFVYSDGDVVTSDAGTLTSDVTLKRDITDATPKLADVMNLQVRNFYWREDYHPNKQDKKLIGFIAQEFEQVFPGMISEHLISGGKPILDEDENETGEKTPEVYKKGIKEGKLIPILVKALQESVARIETLEARLTAAGI